MILCHCQSQYHQMCQVSNKTNHRQSPVVIYFSVSPKTKKTSTQIYMFDGTNLFLNIREKYTIFLYSFNTQHFHLTRFNFLDNCNRFRTPVTSASVFDTLLEGPTMNFSVSRGSTSESSSMKSIQNGVYF